MDLAKRPVDLVLVIAFALFAFTSLVMEPYFVLGALDRADPFAAGWRLYANAWDPIFLRAPTFLRLQCAIDWLLFGPFYVAAIVAFARRREWIRLPALLFVAAMSYSLLLYFGVELIDERGRADLPVVIGVNIPYGIVAALLGWRVRRAPVFAPPE